MKIVKSFLVLLLFLFAQESSVQAQMVGDNVFLQGLHVEVGIAPNGAFGSTLAAPDGYHPNVSDGSFTIYDPGTGSATIIDNHIGFVADPDMDGWDTGTPAYFGDYFLPGTPQEGWSIQVAGMRYDAFTPAYLSDSSTGFTPPLTGNNVGYIATGGKTTGMWQGSLGNLSITQATKVETNGLFFTISVQLKNTGTTPLSNIYYMRTVDPDNEEEEGGAEGFTTDNQIDYQLPDTANRVLVSATGLVYPRAYLGLGTKDCRARAFINDALLVPSSPLDTLYNGETDKYLYSGESMGDVGIGIVYNIGTLAPGDSTTLSYAYILRESQIDSAFNETQPLLLVDGETYSSVDTLLECGDTHTLIPVEIENGGYYDWTWLPAEGLSNTTGISSVINVDSLPSSRVYTISGTSTSGACASKSFTIRFRHITLDPPAVNNNGPICTGNTLSLAAATIDNVSYHWTGPDGYISDEQNPVITPVSLAADGVYTLATTLSACTVTSFDTVTVKATPAVPVITSNSPVCENDILEMSTDSISGDHFSWDGPGGFTDTSSNFSLIADTAEAGVYSLIVKNDGCPSQEVSATIIIYPRPTPPIVDTAFFCRGVKMAVLNATGENLLWYTSSTGGPGDTSAPVIATDIPDTTFWYVSQTINGCEGARAQLTTIVRYQPAASIFHSKNHACQGDTVTFQYNGETIPDGGLFTWSFPEGDIVTNGNTNTKGPFTLQFNSPGGEPIHLHITDADGRCPSNDSFVLVSIPAPVVSIQAANEICAGVQMITGVGYESPNTVQYDWTFGSGVATSLSNDINGKGPYNIYWNEPGVYTIQLIAMNDSLCTSGPIVDTIVVDALPDAQIKNVSNANICSGDSVVFETQSTDEKNYYSWQPAQYFEVQNMPDITGTINNTGYITLTVTDPNGCVNKDSTLITTQDCCTVTFPTAFTPNGDGKNDVFRPITIGHQRISRFIVTNRWGDVIFSTNDQYEGWDGTFKGVPQDIGVYFYYIKYNCASGKTMEQKGEITLLR